MCPDVSPLQYSVGRMGLSPLNVVTSVKHSERVQTSTKDCDLFSSV